MVSTPSDNENERRISNILYRKFSPKGGQVDFKYIIFQVGRFGIVSKQPRPAASESVKIIAFASFVGSLDVVLL